LFEVRDNGVGIPVEKQHALFVPFCQPADHKTAKAKGTGLGLVITKAIIECMGGTIDFESVEDQYTRFFFSIDSAHAQATPRVSFSASESANGRRDAKDDDDDGADDAENDDETDDFVEDEFDLQNDRLPPGARAVFHPSVNENSPETHRVRVEVFRRKTGRALRHRSTRRAARREGEASRATGISDYFNRRRRGEARA
jgi:hypothetical protein